MTERRTPHYTQVEAQTLIIRFQQSATEQEKALRSAVKSEDWAAAHKCAVNLRWDSTNLAGIALDLQHWSSR